MSKLAEDFDAAGPGDAETSIAGSHMSMWPARLRLTCNSVHDHGLRATGNRADNQSNNFAVCRLQTTIYPRVKLDGPTSVMSRLQTQKHKGTRTFLRVAGLLVLAAGLLFTIIGMASFFSAIGSGGPPRLFWCCFLGTPLVFVGGAMCMLGFMGAVARYTAAEQVPIATDAISDIAEGTQGAVKTVARAAAEGMKEGLGDKEQ